ncbi:MAG: hypothetical protein M3P06_23810 [Acidobacteriota bacterium]|nr:hypothetical protein [Acidobacteriota bacterium]
MRLNPGPLCAKVIEMSGARMRILRIDESSFHREYEESRCAIKDFLYMLFEICGDCQPFGDWDRAEVGTVDPYKYLDIAYEYEYQFRSVQEIDFLHRSAALNLLCRLARVDDEDQCSGSTWMTDFRSPDVRAAKEALTRTYHPELFQILEAFESGRIVDIPVIHRAFRAALYGTEDLYPTLGLITAEIVLRTFDGLWA